MPTLKDKTAEILNPKVEIAQKLCNMTKKQLVETAYKGAKRVAEEKGEDMKVTKQELRKTQKELLLESMLKGLGFDSKDAVPGVEPELTADEKKALVKQEKHIAFLEVKQQLEDWVDDNPVDTTQAFNKLKEKRKELLEGTSLLQADRKELSAWVNSQKPSFERFKGLDMRIYTQCERKANSVQYMDGETLVKMPVAEYMLRKLGMELPEIAGRLVELMDEEVPLDRETFVREAFEGFKHNPYVKYDLGELKKHPKFQEAGSFAEIALSYYHVAMDYNYVDKVNVEQKDKVYMLSDYKADGTNMAILLTDSVIDSLLRKISPEFDDQLLAAKDSPVQYVVYTFSLYAKADKYRYVSPLTKTQFDSMEEVIDFEEFHRLYEEKKATPEDSVENPDNDDE